MPWLLACGTPTESSLAAAERRALEALDQTLALPALPDELLPRAASLIPQLLAMLRQADASGPALAQRISKDVVLAAEVLRLASSSYYRAQGDVTDLGHAILLIGEAGLQRAIARVVMKPIFDVAPGPLSARAGGRLWEHADVLARHASALTHPAFDGYVAGLLHDAGWTVALRVLDRAGAGVDLPPSAAFASALADRAHRLFALTAQRWDLSPGFKAFAEDARRSPLATSTNPIAQALRAAGPLAMVELTGAPAAP